METMPEISLQRDHVAFAVHMSMNFIHDDLHIGLYRGSENEKLKVVLQAFQKPGQMWSKVEDEILLDRAL